MSEALLAGTWLVASVWREGRCMVTQVYWSGYSFSEVIVRSGTMALGGERPQLRIRYLAGSQYVIIAETW